MSENCHLGVLCKTIMLGVEHVVDRRQADVLVDAAIAGDEVRVEQFVVVDPRRIAGIVQSNCDVAVRDTARDGIVRDVREERWWCGSPRTAVRLIGAVGVPEIDNVIRPYWECRRHRCR